MPPQEHMDNRRLHLKQQRSRGSEMDHRSEGTASVSRSGRAPSSVYLGPVPLTRDLSDLSGSYANGAASIGSRGAVPGQIYDQSLAKGPWRQAYAVSPLPPQKESKMLSSPRARRGMAKRTSQDSAGVATTSGGALNLSNLAAQGNHNRIPVVILLMDGAQHRFEMLQIWIDRTVDSVRDVVQALQKSIPDKWKQAYDGIFQVRGNRFTQLIHILRLGKYDVQPKEILIAKPWSMNAKVTIAYATGAIRHLTSIGVIRTDEVDKSGRRLFRPKSEEAPLLLSNDAQNRLYVPDGILCHHHAVQFLSFSPPFEAPRQSTDQASVDANSSLGSQCDSVVSGQAPTSGLMHDDVASATSFSAMSTGNRQPTQVSKSPDSAPPVRSTSLEEELAFRGSYTSHVDDSYSGERNGNINFIFGQLNCCRSKDRIAALTCCPQSNANLGGEEHWASFDIRPIAEDHSSQNHSLPSVSAPLLSGFEPRTNGHRSRGISRKAVHS